METRTYETDVLIIGGGTAGTMAAIKAKQTNPALHVLVLDKADIRRSGAISMGMDGLNNAVVPGKATPEEYTLEITESNDGIIDQRAVFAKLVNAFPLFRSWTAGGSILRRMPMGTMRCTVCIAKGVMCSRCLKQVISSLFWPKKFASIVARWLIESWPQDCWLMEGRL